MMKTSQQDIIQLQATLSLLDTLQALEQYQTFCYNLYLLATYYANKPHAVKTVGTKNYNYDEVGNMTNRNGQSITYTPLNKPATLTNHLNGKTVTFTYGAGGQRYMKQTSDNKYTFYIGKAYEEQVEDNTQKEICYITLGGKTIGTHTEVKDTNYVQTNPHYNEATYNRYFHTDALGSITAITDDTGKVIERRSYEAFGKIRAMDYGTNNNTIANTTIQTTRAFTGHEQIAELSGLIHMNARIYDSDIGRFLSADTVVQDPHDSQAYNRYSYARNNPMVFTDPSGHSWWTDFRDKWVKPIVGIVVGVLVAIYAPQFLSSYFNLATGTLGSAVATGALAGAAGGAIMTGTLSGTLKGAAFGALSAGVANIIGHGSNVFARIARTGKTAKAILHGLSRAAISKLRSGSGKGGFLSGFAASLLGGTIAENFGNSHTIVKVTMAAIAGGTASALGGGKFSNGAMSGAFIMMFNELANTLQKTYFSTFGENITVGVGAELATGVYWTEDGSRWGYLTTAGGTLGFDASVDYSYGWIYGSPEDLAGFYFSSSAGIGFVGGESLYDGNGDFRGGKASFSAGVPVSFKYSATYTWLRDGGTNVNIYDSPMSTMF